MLLFDDKKLEDAVQKNIERHEMNGTDAAKIWDWINKIETAHAALEVVKLRELEILLAPNGEPAFVKSGTNYVP